MCRHIHTFFRFLKFLWSQVLLIRVLENPTINDVMKGCFHYKFENQLLYIKKSALLTLVVIQGLENPTVNDVMKGCLQYKLENLWLYIETK